jgi:hypothetical protein
MSLSSWPVTPRALWHFDCKTVLAGVMVDLAEGCALVRGPMLGDGHPV